MQRILVVLALLGGVASAEENPWAAVATPSAGPAAAIGGYSTGCLAGGAPLPLAGEGYRVMSPERKRTFGHPLLIALIARLGRAAKAERLGLLGVGDLGQPRGGPAPNGHASHQTGLDVDLWYVVGGSRRKPRAEGLVTAKTLEVTPALDRKVARLLELAATDERVARIFVHPSIKRALCAERQTRPWLARLRPWWGHDHHFHVRLACPADSPACVPQEPLPPGDGCDELEWWFSASAESDRAEQRKQYQQRVGARPPLPEGCAAVVAKP